MEKKRRPRRSNFALERDIINALREQVEEVGFQNITFNKLVAKAGVEPNVFYKRFENIDSLLDYFAQKYDFWFTGITEYHNIDNLEEYYAKTLKNLSNSLYKNKIMQKLLLWELTDDNPTTRRTAYNREKDSEELCELLDKHFRVYGVKNIRTITAILIGGIYYLTLHKERSTFCGVDFDTKNGKIELQEATDLITHALFSLIETNKEASLLLNDNDEVKKLIEKEANGKANELAIEKTGKIMLNSIRKMKSKGLTVDDIVECTGLPRDMIEEM